MPPAPNNAAPLALLVLPLGSNEKLLTFFTLNTLWVEGIEGQELPEGRGASCLYTIVNMFTRQSLVWVEDLDGDPLFPLGLHSLKGRVREDRMSIVPQDPAAQVIDGVFDRVSKSYSNSMTLFSGRMRNFGLAMIASCYLVSALCFTTAL
jgi:hypothetical protein